MIDLTPRRIDDSVKNATEMAYETLKAMIMDNKLKPSASYLEAELAEILDISRTPTREAMLQLNREGFIKMRPRHGMSVVPLSGIDMQEIYQILMELEPLAAKLAAQRGLTAEELSAMQQAVDQMDTCLLADDRIGWAKADDIFHALLAQYSGNMRLQKTIGNFADQVYRARMTTLMMRDKPVRSNIEHRAVLECLKNQEPEKAQLLHRQHRESASKMIVELIEKHRLDNL